MEQALGEAVDVLLKAGGPFAALAIIEAIVIAYLFRMVRSGAQGRLEDAHKCATLIEESFKERLSEFERIITALNQNTATSLTLTSSSDARTVAFQELIKAFAVLVEQSKAAQLTQTGQAERVERGQEDIRRNQQDILQAIRSVSLAITRAPV